ncbi:hypothetical protein WJX81_000774 [Elliptochloris bilobata]|uniref:N-acetyltransferase domain-containing protein n=1 Tax=Elliptochloris bilobata TaxID=381761 RepID=A0AAW1S891_9CHLO
MASESWLAPLADLNVSDVSGTQHGVLVGEAEDETPRERAAPDFVIRLVSALRARLLAVVYEVTRGNDGAAQLSEQKLLSHGHQRQVASLAWRPRSGTVLAVGAAGGVCIWGLGRSPAGGAAAVRTSAAGGAWLSFLRAAGCTGRVTALSWSPDGQLLAAAAEGMPGFMLWDVTLGMGTLLRSGLAGVALLRWSPDGAYLLAGSTGAGFRLWETQKWTSQLWSTEAGALAGAAWAPDSRTLLIAAGGARQLAALCLTRPAPALDAQLLPLPLPAPPPAQPCPAVGARGGGDEEGFRVIGFSRHKVLSVHLQESEAAIESVTTSEGLDVVIRNVEVEDFWALAEVHCQSFYPRARWPFAAFLRLDRVVAMQVGLERDRRFRQGRFQCLVACEPRVARPLLPHGRAHREPGAAVPPLFKWLVQRNLQEGFELGPADVGLLGAVVVDTQGDYLPTLVLDADANLSDPRPRPWRSGHGIQSPADGSRPLQKVAYISNLAVVSTARRRGLGRLLVRRAEELARSWGAEMIALHCDCNDPAMFQMYRKFGYERVKGDAGLPWSPQAEPMRGPLRTARPVSQYRAEAALVASNG